MKVMLIEPAPVSGSVRHSQLYCVHISTVSRPVDARKRARRFGALVVCQSDVGLCPCTATLTASDDFALIDSVSFALLHACMHVHQ